MQTFQIISSVNGNRKLKNFDPEISRPLVTMVRLPPFICVQFPNNVLLIGNLKRKLCDNNNDNIIYSKSKNMTKYLCDSFVQIFKFNWIRNLKIKICRQLVRVHQNEHLRQTCFTLKKRKISTNLCGNSCIHRNIEKHFLFSLSKEFSKNSIFS